MSRENNECLYTKKSNCKNCYKCIRHCPVKSIKFFNEQAHIIHDECILCGECYVVCPQNAKQIRNDLDMARGFIKEGAKVYASLAPSYIARFPKTGLSSIEKALKKLGFAGVDETAVGAVGVKKHYEQLINDQSRSIVISSCCHTVNSLIEKHYPRVVPYLAGTITPMAMHAKILKQRHENSKVVFIGPCISKKEEAFKYKSVDCVLTFDELEEWFKSEGVEIEIEDAFTEKARTRSFPTAGGIIRSMDQNPNYNYVVVDGIENCIRALKSIDSGDLKNCFIEMSACQGSCVSGPILKKNQTNPVGDLLDVLAVSGGKDFEISTPEEKVISKKFTYEYFKKTIPGNAAILEILNKMGKHTPEQELNCGSCGYNTCRDKALAVFMGKADLSMCMPYLKDKAESFSENIIQNTPNGIFVMDENLKIQQINGAAKKILNLPEVADIIGNPVDRLLDPVDYVIALNNRENVYDNRKFLVEYNKYIEETIILDEEFNIVIVIMKDVSVEEEMRNTKEKQNKAVIDITDKVVEKQMRIVQEIASLLGETAAETKIALTKLKETLSNE